MISRFLEKVRRPEKEVDPDVEVRRPATDIYETGDSLVFLVDLPGVAARDLTLDCGKEELSVSAPVAGEEKVLYRRRFLLPGNLDPTSAKAKLQDGVLEVRLPKKVPDVKRIKVNVE